MLIYFQKIVFIEVHVNITFSYQNTRGLKQFLYKLNALYRHPLSLFLSLLELHRTFPCTPPERVVKVVAASKGIDSTITDADDKPRSRCPKIGQQVNLNMKGCVETWFPLLLRPCVGNMALNPSKPSGNISCRFKQCYSYESTINKSALMVNISRVCEADNRTLNWRVHLYSSIRASFMTS